MLKIPLFLLIFSFQASYALKYVYELEVTWINPALILGLGMLVLHVAIKGNMSIPKKESQIVQSGLIFAAVYMMAGITALLEEALTNSGIVSTIYAYVREPVRLALCMLLFFLPLITVRTREVYFSILKSFVWIGIAQFGLALYMIMAVLVKLPMPQGWSEYMPLYFWRQALYLPGIAIPRLGGTFVEAPIFGLFMLCAIIANILLLKFENSALYRFTLGILLLGIALCLSSQVLLAIAVLAILSFLPRLFEKHITPKVFIGAMSGIVILTLGVGTIAYRKTQESQNLRIQGQSVGERVFHASYSLDKLAEKPILGIGPGMYGYYAAKEGGWLNTVTVQAMVPEILAETGILGFFAFLYFCFTLGHWLWSKRDSVIIGGALALLIASLFQSTWKWDFVFFTLGIIVVYFRFVGEHKTEWGRKWKYL